MATLQETMAITDRISSPMLAAMNSIQSVLNIFGRLDTELGAGVSTEFANEIHAAAERSQQDINDLAAAFAGFSDTPVRAPTIPTVTQSVPAAPRIPQWQIGNSNEWFSSNWDRQIKEASSGMFEVAQLQNKIEAKAAGLTVLSPQAQNDIGNMGSKIAEVHSLIQQIKNTPLNISTEEAEIRMSDIRAKVEQIYSMSGRLDILIDTGNIAQANAEVLKINENISNVMNTARDMLQPVKWQSDTSLEVFNTAGIERWQQEVTRADSLISQLGTNINSITQNAAFNNILPPNAIADMTRINERIGRIQQRVQELNSRPANVITDAEIREVEQLSQQLNQALQIERQVNEAAENMDVSAANAAYRQLSQTIGNTERFLRDNTSEQQNFNNEIQKGQSEMDKLTGFIKKAVGAFVSLQTVKKVIDISDQMTSTTARLNLLVDTDRGNESIDELQEKIFNAAQNARGSFSDMASFVARVGNNAGKAFTDNDELIKFAELVQKEFAISGATAAEAQNASIQLSQALGAGVLRGQDLNSVFSQAPELINTIAEGLNIDIGQIRSMAAEGEITAQQVKNAVLGAANKIDNKFNDMPKTWSQAWQSMKNSAFMAFQPVLENLNGIVNSSEFQDGTDSIINSFSSIANTAVKVIKPVGGIISNALSVVPNILGALDPVISIISKIAEFVENNMDFITDLVNKTANGISVIFSLLEPVVDFALSAAQFIIDNWSVIGPVIFYIAAALGVLVTAFLAVKAALAVVDMAKAAFSLLSNPVTLVILAVAVLIAVIFKICDAVAKATGAANSGFGIICGGVMVVVKFFQNLGLAVGNFAIAVWNAAKQCVNYTQDVILGIWEAAKAVISNIKIFFIDAWLVAQVKFWEFYDSIISGIKGIADNLNNIIGVFGLEIDTSGLEKYSAAAKIKKRELEASYIPFEDVGAAFQKGYQTYEFKDPREAWKEGINTFDVFQDGWAEDAFNSGAAWGDGIVDKINSVFGGNDENSELDKYMKTLNSGLNGIGSGIDDIAGDTSAISDSLDISEEDLKYLRDIAERDAVNRFTTAEVTVEFGGVTTNVNSETDIDGMIDYFATNVKKAMEITAEGVHA